VSKLYEQYLSGITLKEDYYDVASVLMDVPNHVKIAIAKIASTIPKEKIDVEAGGIEDDVHITVIYGIPEELDLRQYFMHPIKMRTDNKISYFETDKATVAKVAIFSEDLGKLHYAIKDNVPNTHKYEYSPHLTIAYLKKGERLDSETFPIFEWWQTTVDLMKNGLLDRINLGSISEAKGTFKKLKDNRVELSPEERKEVMAKKAVWHFNGGNPSPAVWKSVDSKGKAVYITNTHRAYQARPTLKGAISIFHSFIKSTA